MADDPRGVSPIRALLPAWLLKQSLQKAVQDLEFRYWHLNVNRSMVMRGLSGGLPVFTGYINHTYSIEDDRVMMMERIEAAATERRRCYATIQAVKYLAFYDMTYRKGLSPSDLREEDLIC